MSQPNSDDSSEGLTGRLVRRHTFPLTIGIVLCAGLSVASWFLIPVEVMPRENVPPFLALQVEARESMPVERMEMALTLPLEGAVRSLAQLLNFSSSTSSRSVSLSLTYKPRTDLDMAEFALTEALQDLESQGILDMKSVSVSRMNPDATAVAKLSVSFDSAIANPLKLIKEEFRLGLESIPEISKIEISGLETPQYTYEIPLARMGELGLENQGLSEFLSAQAVREPVGAGKFGSESFVTAVNARQASLDFSQLQSQRLKKGSTFTLRDIASEKSSGKNEISRKNGLNAVFVEIFAKEGASLFDLNKNLSEYLTKLSQLPEHLNSDLGKLQFETIFNRADDLKHAINDVFESLYEAIAITFFVVYVFLRRWRPTALISTTIPATLLLTIFALYARGVSLNILTLSGLILGIGMVVDSAILVVDRIGELRAQGFERKAAAAKGAEDAAAALTMSTLTNAAIFLPVAFIEGGDSFTDILKAFQMPIVASLAASFFVALLFLPVATIFWKDKESHGETNDSESASPRALTAFRWLQARRIPVLIGSLAVIFCTVQYILDIRETDLESPRDSFSTLSVRFAPELPQPQRRVLFEGIERDLLEQQAQLGYRFVISDFNPSLLNGSFMVYPLNSQDQDKTMDEMEKGLKAYLAKLYLRPGVQVTLGWGGSHVSSSARRYEQYKFSGPKLAKLNELNSQLSSELKKVTGVETVRLEREESGERNFIFLPNEAVMLHYGLNLGKISSEISKAMSSASLNNLNFNGRAVGAKISFAPPGQIWTLETLKGIRIRFKEKLSVTLSELGTLRPSMTTPSISRKEGTANSRIYVYYQQRLGEQEYAEARRKVRAVADSFKFPHGYGVPKADSQERIEEMARKSDFIILLSGLLIYLLLAGMFESVLLPLAILFTVPLALIFGIAGLKLVGMDLDVMARLSLIILVGIGVNSAIILIDLIENLRAQGLRREDAVVQGCARRLRAVLMTTTIQIISVLPVALGKAKIMGIPYSSLGVAIISGMLLSTIGTLVLLPMTYEWLDDVEQSLKRLLHLSPPAPENRPMEQSSILPDTKATVSSVDQSRAA